MLRVILMFYVVGTEGNCVLSMRLRFPQQTRRAAWHSKEEKKNNNETLMDSRLTFFFFRSSSYDSSWLYIILFSHFVRAQLHSDGRFCFRVFFHLKWKCQSTQLFRKKHLYLFLYDFIHKSTILPACVYDFQVALNSCSCSQSVDTVRNCDAISERCQW